ncbi:MAG: O-antigen ligase family protein [Flavobacteriales bacterium]|nr:O-antigen ligase family protein [Flavobacteriales bacterium]
MRILDILVLDLRFYLLLTIWVIGCIIFHPFAYAILPVVFVLGHRERYFEVLILFLFVLILSDSTDPLLMWSQSFKNILVLTLGVVFVLKYKFFSSGSGIIRYFLPFFVIAIVCLAYSPIPIVGSQKMLSYFLVFIIVPKFVLEAIKIQGRIVLKRFLVFGLIVLVISLFLGYIGGPDSIGMMANYRLNGVFGNPNGLGIYVLIFTCFVVALKEVYTGLISRVEYLVILGFVLFIVVQTGSRGALMSLIVLIASNSLFKLSPWIGILVIFFIIAIYDFLLSYFIATMIDLGLQEELRLDKIEDASGRVIAWTFAWDNIQDSFFLGKGFGYDRNLTRINFMRLSKLGHEGGVHNSFLMLWLNVGLLGLIAWLRGMFLVTIKGNKNTRVALPILISVFISAFFEGWLVGSLNPFTPFFLITLTVLTSKDFINVGSDAAVEKNFENKTIGAS